LYQKRYFKEKPVEESHPQSEMTEE